MDPDTYRILELNKIIERLAGYAAFSASEMLLRALEPSGDLEEVLRRQQETTEARNLLEAQSHLGVGGARDVRPHVQDAARGSTLRPEQLLDIRATLLAAGTLKRAIGKRAGQFPLLNEIALGIDEGKPLVAAISRVLSDEGEVLDSASEKLARIRQELQSTRARLQDKLQSLVTSSQYASYLQEPIITMRGGRYVLPIKAEYKGRIQGIVHDQSASGATLFIEPLPTVEINNRIRELELDERDEVRRILSELSALVGAEADRLIWTVEALAQLDAAFAKARYASALRASAPHLVDFDPKRTPGSTIRLYSARHPLLDPQTVVPIDVELDEETYSLVITGPNTGGKTVTLKTIGLLALMAQCGLHIPAAEGSTLTVFRAIYADIGDEQSIEQSLSTFSAHLRRIIRILAQADQHALVLLDELGSGTDPAEGAAIARAILTELLQRGVTTFVATHYPELKLFAHSTPGVRNASVEFDIETLSPTYHLIIGLPGRSNALAIAQRLGLPERVIERARSYIGAADLQADDLLDEIHRTRQEIRQAQARLVAAEAEVQALRAELQARLESIEEERRAIIEEARAQAQAELEAVRAEVEALRRRLRRASPPEREAAPSPEELKDVEAEVESLEELLEAPVEPVTVPLPAAEPAEAAPLRALRPGDRVYVPGLNAEGEIIALNSGDDVEVRVGQLRVRVDADSLEWRASAGEREAEETSPEAGIRVPHPESPGVELYLRGYTIEDALPMLEEYLDQAYLAGLPWVRIVHGKGTGRLRQAVREHLRQHPLVKEYKPAPGSEGGEGVTIVYFAS
ncbi:MAG TPA: endonuclease MutS2 [Chloroflexi bacterium]|nr:endonuclease MutS2 [Chloroflexota bacterium]